MTTFLEIVALLGIGNLFFGWLRSLPEKLWKRFQDRKYVTFHIDDRSEPAQWLTAWFDTHKLWRNTSSVEVSNLGTHHTKKDYAYSWGNGTHVLDFKGTRLQVNKSSSKDSDGRVEDDLSIRFPADKRHLMSDLLREAKDIFEYGDGFSVLLLHYDSWNVFRREPLRTLDSLVLPREQKETIVADAKSFFASEQWYKDRGLPHRRGYLFSGVPGSGKSTLVSCLASELKCNVYWLDLMRLTSDTELVQAFSSVAAGSIVLIEDIDALLVGRNVKANDAMKHVSFTGLLAVLDSMLGAKSSLVIMTTNHPEKLDPALIRPGRVDVHVKFDHATQEQAAALYERFYGMPLRSPLKQQVSMAALQAHFLKHRDDPKAGAELNSL